jgi:hypothetical protein
VPGVLRCEGFWRLPVDVAAWGLLGVCAGASPVGSSVIQVRPKRVTMACKPPRTYSVPARLRSPRQHAAGASTLAGAPRFCRAVHGQSQRCCQYGHSQRNAVGHVGVKLGAAPDAPHWGQVLVRTPSECLPSARWRAISTFICPSRDVPVCPALAKDLVSADPCGMQPRPGWPASYGACGRRWQIATRQRAARRRCSPDPHPGKDPL